MRPAVNSFCHVTANYKRRQWREGITTYFRVIECNTLRFRIIERNAIFCCIALAEGAIRIKSPAYAKAAANQVPIIQSK